ncbi:MAG: bifunctional diaminohydroxyphosphoribosylaminopyrimidine deaminase/5-amino-6-(5-phosphoribosylamino)uracil reductase RibD, partial [Actinomycetota bacterium]
MRRTVDNPFDGAAVDKLMRRAVEATADTYPHPNPRVGAIVISPDGAVRSVAAHVRAGSPHAERLALVGLDNTAGDTMVVTLEPCSHHGRTPPCTDAIIEAGITRVFIGTVDPDARVSGQGIAALRAAGVEVIDSGLSDIVERNDPGYYHHRRTGRPRVTLKMAATLDGQVAALDGTSQWITSPEARQDAHRLRGANDGVLIGAGTLRTDDPELTVRLDGFHGPQPVPVVLKGSEALPADAKLWGRDPIVMEPGDDGTVSVIHARDELANSGFTSVLVEGGAHVARSFLDSDTVDEIVMYV